MGNVVATSMKEAQRELQVRLAIEHLKSPQHFTAEMQEKQLRTMILTQERMRRMQIAQMLAASRERFYWFGTAYSLLLTGATAFAFKNKHLPPTVGVPIIAGGFFMAYQYDLCWGNKIERISKMADELATEDRWFNPSMPSQADIDRQLNPIKPKRAKA